MCKSLHVKCPLLLLYFNETSVYYTDFRKKKKTQILDFIKIHPVGDDLFHADGRTDGQDEANSRFS